MEENNNVQTKKTKKGTDSLKRKALLATVFALGAVSMYVSLPTVALVFLALFVVPVIFAKRTEKD